LAGAAGAAGSGAAGAGAPTPTPAPGETVRTPSRFTGDGMFATDHWKAGGDVRERFSLAIPADWSADGLAIGLIVTASTGEVRRPTGAAAGNDPFTAVLGVLPLAARPR
jgi:hypothetical protein